MLLLNVFGGICFMRLLKSASILILLGSLAVSCAVRQTSVVIKQGNPQQFIISGHGILDVFTISGPRNAYWVIAPLEDFDVSRFRELGPIVYGQVPPGFRQAIPFQGQPPPISEGSRYSVQLAIRNGGGVNMLFWVHDGKIVTEADAD